MSKKEIICPRNNSKTTWQFYNHIQERINKGEIEIVNLGVIKGINRYKFKEKKSEK